MEKKKPSLKQIASHTSLLLFIILLGIQLNSLSHQITNISSQFHHSIKQNSAAHLTHQINELLARESWIFNEDWQVLDVDIQQELISLEFNWSMKEVQEDAVIGLQIQQQPSKGESDGLWSMVQAESIGVNTYRATVEVSPSHTYGVQVVSQGKKTRLSSSLPIPTYLYQPPKPVPVSYTTSHHNDPSYKEGDVFVVFQLKDEWDLQSRLRAHPSLSFEPKAVKAEFLVDGTSYSRSLKQVERENPPTQESFHGDPEKAWKLSFPAHEKGSEMNQFLLEVTYTNGLTISHDLLHHEYHPFPTFHLPPLNRMYPKEVPNES